MVYLRVLFDRPPFHRSFWLCVISWTCLVNSPMTYFLYFCREHGDFAFLHVTRKQRWNILLCKWRDIFSSHQWRRSSPPAKKKHRGAGGPSATEYELCWGLNFGLNSVLLKEGSILDRSDFVSNYKVPHMTKLRGGGLMLSTPLVHTSQRTSVCFHDRGHQLPQFVFHREQSISNSSAIAVWEEHR